MDSEVALILTQKMGSDEYVPAAVPLYGRYSGQGLVEDVQDGPNSDLVLAAFQKGLSEGSVVIDWHALGLASMEVDHIETLLSLVSCAQVQGGSGVVWDQAELGFALVQAHVAAALMESEPEDLPAAVPVDHLADEVVGATSAGRAIYGPLRGAGPRLRCKFGLSFVALQALKEGLADRDLGFIPPGSGVPEEEAQPQLWLAEALVEAQEDQELALALADYAAKDEESL